MALPMKDDHNAPVASEQGVLSLSVGEAAARVGLTAATLRTWDRRYGLAPSLRTAGGHRRYSSTDMERLRTAAQLIEAGHPAAQAVAASMARVVGDDTSAPGAGRAGGGKVLPLPEGTAEQRGLARSAMSLDADAITALITTMIDQHGVIGTWDRVISPVLVSVGERWARTGTGVEVEHVLATGVAAALMKSLPRSVNGRRPVLLACMPDEEHMLPLLALHSALLAEGTPSVLLGHKVPQGAMVDAVKRVRPRKVGLWAQMPARADSGIVEVLPQLRPPLSPVLLGPGWRAASCGDYPRPATLTDAVAELAYAR